MIPYFQSPSFPLGPFTVEVFGIFAALGIYVCVTLSVGRALRRGLPAEPLANFAFWCVITGIVFGHLVHLFLYHPEELQKPWQVFKLWDGLSSFGGVLGGFLATIVFFRLKKLPAMAFGDSVAPALALGWGIARIGCFVVHDHLGVRTSFPLAVAFPDGARHDLGLYDALWLFAISAVLFALSHQKKLEGRLMGLLAVMYATGRFFFDFLRATDVPYADKRYAGLTPAQYFCFLLVAWGLYILARRGPAPVIPAPPAGTPAAEAGPGAERT